MEDINQKLNSENVFLQSQALTDLVVLIKEKDKNPDTISKCEEIKKLWSIVNEGTTLLTPMVVEAIVCLVSLGFLPAFATMQNFIAHVSVSESPASIIRGITQLLILMCEVESIDKATFTSPYTGPPKGPIHPYVSVLNKNPNMTPVVIEEVRYMLNHPNEKIRFACLSILRPVLFHLFCYTEETAPAVKLLNDVLISSQNILDNSVINVICELITLTKVQSKNHIERKVMLLCYVASFGENKKDLTILSAVLPCLIISLPHAIKYGLPIRTVEMQISSITEQLCHGCDISICALAEALSSTSGSLQLTLLKTAMSLLSHQDGNPLIATMLLPSVLQILSVPSDTFCELYEAASSLVRLIQLIPAQTSRATKLLENEYWTKLSLSYPDLHIFIHAINLSNSFVKDDEYANSWLTKLNLNIPIINKFYYQIITTIFIYRGTKSQTVEKATQVFQREVMKNNKLAFELFPILLHRMAYESCPQTKLTLLYLLPALAINKLCVSMILKTFFVLWQTSYLKPLILRLLLDVWKVEPRVYSHLMRLIQDKSENTRELDTARAYVVYSICKAKPSQHGEELLPLLSTILNENKGKEGTAQTMIALDGIYELCSAVIIDLRTTWKVIAPKLVKDKREEIIIKLCRLLSLTSKLKVNSNEYEDFSVSVSTILWEWAAGNISDRVTEAAYKALEKINARHFHLNMIPIYAQEECRVTNPEVSERSPLPGVTWVNLVSNCPNNHLPFVENFSKSLIEKEVMALPKGIYTTAIQEAKRKGYKASGGQPEPRNYNFLNDSLALKAYVNFLVDFPKLLNERKENENKLFNGLNIIIQSLGQPLNRPFPALDWIFLSNVLNVCEKYDLKSCGDSKYAEITKYGIWNIAAQQCNKSPSALNLISNWLKPSAKLTNQDEIYLIGLLNHLGRGVSTSNLQEFLKPLFVKALKDNKHLTELLKTIKSHLMCDYIQDSNRNAISNIIESLNDKIDPNDEDLYAAYKDCVADLPLKQIERLTSPSLWWEISDEKLYKAAILRCHVASKDGEDDALQWLNDLVDCVGSLPGDRSHFLKIMAQTLIARNKIEERSSWLLTLLGTLQGFLKKEPGNNKVLIQEYEQRILFYMDLLILSLIIWSGLWINYSLTAITDSRSLRDSLICSTLILLNKIPEWQVTLAQLLNCFIPNLNLLELYIGNKYKLKIPVLQLASVSNSLSQPIWNKIID